MVIAGLGAGGAERVVSLLTRSWAAEGRSVTVIAFDEEGDAIFHPLDPRVRVLRLGIGPAGGARLAGLAAVVRRCRALRRTLDALAPDVTIAFLTKINVLTLLASLGRDRRVIISERNNPSLQHASQWWTTALRMLHRRADAIVMQTHASLECLGGAARRRAVVIPNPILVGAIDRSRHAEWTLVATGRLTWQKGFDRLIDAFARIADRHPRWRLVIRGEGELRAALEQQVRERGLKGRVSLPGNSRTPGEWIGEADAFVLSSRYEGFANALGEAMAGGLPVVAFDCAYSPADMIRHEENGLLVADGDVAALAANLDRLLSDADLRGRLGRAARATGERLRPAAIAEQWEQLLRQVVR